MKIGGAAELLAAGWSVVRLRIGIFTSAERTPGTLRRGGWVGPEAGFKILEEVSYPCPTQNTAPSTLYRSRYADCATLAPLNT